MNTNSPTYAKHLMFRAVSVISLVLVAVLGLSSQQLQKGVSVQLAPTNNAKPMPAADDQNAWVVSISSDGRLWFGADLVTRDGLVNKMISTPRNRNQNLYIKADARAAYSDVEFVLKASHTAEFDAPVLLTAQKESPQPGSVVSPKGLDVSLESGATLGPKPAEIDVVATQDATIVKVNSQQVSWENLQPTLEQLFGNRTENVVRLKADDGLPFAQIVRAIDACRSRSSKVILVTPSA
jgi:biopolymer transport protein ExbD